MMTTLIGSLYFTAVANSPMSMVKPPSPTKATHWRSGYATCAAIAYGRPGAIVARLPESEKSWSPRMSMWRATQLVIVPLSELMIALSASSSFSSCAMTSGLIGVSLRVPRSRMRPRHSFIRFWLSLRKPRARRRTMSGANA